MELTESGFINLTLHLSEVLNYLQKSEDEVLETIKDTKPKKYILDYGGPNIGKSMHVGHLRPLNIGRAYIIFIKFQEIPVYQIYILAIGVYQFLKY